jgi:hypothetical protein
LSDATVSDFSLVLDPPEVVRTGNRGRFEVGSGGGCGLLRKLVVAQWLVRTSIGFAHPTHPICEEGTNSIPDPMREPRE